MTNLLVRVDAHPAIGNGHLMRCLALAAEWRAQGGEVIFLACCPNRELVSRATAAGVNVLPLTKSHPDPSDVPATLSAIERFLPAWIVIDGYNFDLAFQEAVRGTGVKVLVIDDMGQLPCYSAEIILNTNTSAELVPYGCIPETKKLLGPCYALLRPEFLSWRYWNRKISAEASRLLVTLGGGDQENTSLKVLNAVKLIDFKLETKIVVGPLNPFLEDLREASPGPNIEIVANVSDMAPLMAWADLAITGGGVSCWESAFLGLPSLILVVADNQRCVAATLEAAGIALTLGDANAVSPDEIAGAIDRLAHSAALRSDMSRLGRLLVDGGGAARVVREMRRISDRKSSHPSGIPLSSRPQQTDDER